MNDGVFYVCLHRQYNQANQSHEDFEKSYFDSYPVFSPNWLLFAHYVNIN